MPKDSWVEAFDAGDFDDALALLRPEVCRYAIWYRSHTAPWVAADPERAELLLSIDILALGDYLSMLQDCYHAAGLRDDYPDVLERFEPLVDDPRWNHQILLQRVYWTLRPDWDRAKGVELLADIDIDEVTDPELVTVFIDVHRDHLPAPRTMELCDKILQLTDEATYQLQYSILKGILWIFLGEGESGVSVIESALSATEGEPIEPGWGQYARVTAMHIVGAHRDDETLLQSALDLAGEMLESDRLLDRGRAEIFNLVGDINAHLARFEEAATAYRTSLEFDSTAAPARISLARSYIALGDLGAAQVEFAELRSLELDAKERVDYVLARAGLLFLVSQEDLVTELREELESLEPEFPMHREVRDRLLRDLVTLDAKDSKLLARLKSIWASVGDYVILRPNLFGFGVDLKALGDALLNVTTSDVSGLDPSNGDPLDAELPN